ncbi:PIG-L family deacetylase [soil metagenome]
MTKQHSIDNILKGKKKILAVVSHPDDFEDYFAGAMMYGFDKKLITPDMIHLLICTDGCAGGRAKYTDPELLKAMRQQEQHNALAKLNIPKEQCYFLDFKDGYLHNNDNVLTERISYHIRKVKPDLLLTHNGFEAIIEKPQGTYYIHKDHRVVGEAALDACYPYSRDLLFFPEHHQEGLEGHFILEILVSETQTPNVKVDFTDYLDRKVDLIKSFMTQIESDAWLYKYFKDTMTENDRYIEVFKYLKIII